MKLLVGGTEASLKGHTHEMSEINGLMTEINLLKSSSGLSPNPSLNSLSVTNDIKVWQGQNGGWRVIISEVNARASATSSATTSSGAKVHVYMHVKVALPNGKETTWREAQLTALSASDGFREIVSRMTV